MLMHKTGLIIIAITMLVLVIASGYFIGIMRDDIAEGMGLKTAAIIAAVISFVSIIIMAVAAGDGLIGELQFMIPGMLTFFMISWLMIAWVF